MFQRACWFAVLGGAWAQRGTTCLDSLDDCEQDSCCAMDGSDYTYAESTEGVTRSILTSHCPNHNYYSLTPNFPFKEDTTYAIPLYPMYVDSAYTVSLGANDGAVGVLFDGASFYSAYSGPSYEELNMTDGVNDYFNSAPYAEGYSFDMCGEHSSSNTTASYHAHAAPGCLLNQLGAVDSAASPQVGWAVDGFPVYGPRGPGGVMMRRCTEALADADHCLDQCGGYHDSTYYADGYVYRYFLLGYYNEDETSCDMDMWAATGDGDSPACSYEWAESFYPFTPLCFKSCCPEDAVCSWEDLPSCADFPDEVDGTTDALNATFVNEALAVNTMVDACDSCDDYFPATCTSYQTGEACALDGDCVDSLSCVSNVCATTRDPSSAPTHVSAHPTMPRPSMPPTMPGPTNAQHASAHPTAACPESDSWFKLAAPSKHCAWVSLAVEGRCTAKGDDGSFAYDACQQSCGCTVPPTLAHTPAPSSVAQPTPDPTLPPTLAHTPAPSSVARPTPDPTQPTLDPTSVVFTTATAHPTPSPVPVSSPTQPQKIFFPTVAPSAAKLRAVSGSVTVSGVASRSATDHLEVFEIAVAASGGVAASSVTCSVTSRRRLEESATVAVEYELVAYEAEALAAQTALDGLTLAAFDVAVGTAAVQLDVSDLFADVATTAVSPTALGVVGAPTAAPSDGTYAPTSIPTSSPSLLPTYAPSVYFEFSSAKKSKKSEKPLAWIVGMGILIAAAAAIGCCIIAFAAFFALGHHKDEETLPASITPKAQDTPLTVLEPEPEKPVDEEPLELEEVAPFEPEPEPEPAPAPAPASASAEEPPFTSLSAFCYGEDDKSKDSAELLDEGLVKGDI